MYNDNYNKQKKTKKFYNNLKWLATNWSISEWNKDDKFTKNTKRFYKNEQ